MPVYTFECSECSVRFERSLKMDNHPTHPCPSCKDPAPIVLDAGFGFAFGKGGGSTANSGVHDHDYPTADKAVGRSADERWEMYGEREKVKNEARKQGGTHALIRHTSLHHIDYEPMTPGGQTARRNLAKAAVKALREGPDPKK